MEITVQIFSSQDTSTEPLSRQRRNIYGFLVKNYVFLVKNYVIFQKFNQNCVEKVFIGVRNISTQFKRLSVEFLTSNGPQ